MARASPTVCCTSDCPQCSSGLSRVAEVEMGNGANTEMLPEVLMHLKIPWEHTLAKGSAQ